MAFKGVNPGPVKTKIAKFESDITTKQTGAPGTTQKKPLATNTPKTKGISSQKLLKQKSTKIKQPKTPKTPKVKAQKTKQAIEATKKKEVADSTPKKVVGQKTPPVAKTTVNSTTIIKDVKTQHDLSNKINPKPVKGYIKSVKIKSGKNTLASVPASDKKTVKKMMNTGAVSKHKFMVNNLTQKVQKQSNITPKAKNTYFSLSTTITNPVPQKKQSPNQQSLPLKSNPDKLFSPEISKPANAKSSNKTPNTRTGKTSVSNLKQLFELKPKPNNNSLNKSLKKKSVSDVSSNTTKNNLPPRPPKTPPQNTNTPPPRPPKSTPEIPPVVPNTTQKFEQPPPIPPRKNNKTIKPETKQVELPNTPELKNTSSAIKTTTEIPPVVQVPNKTPELQNTSPDIKTTTELPTEKELLPEKEPDVNNKSLRHETKTSTISDYEKYIIRNREQSQETIELNREKRQQQISKLENNKQKKENEIEKLRANPKAEPTSFFGKALFKLFGRNTEQTIAYLNKQKNRIDGDIKTAQLNDKKKTKEEQRTEKLTEQQRIYLSGSNAERQKLEEQKSQELQELVKNQTMQT